MDRESSLDDFRAGYVPLMFATSVAARGLDVKQLTLVINYDVPNHLEDYVHRAGRTGRAGKTGTAITFITPQQERYSVDVVKALKQSEAPVPEELQKMADSFWDKVKAGSEKRYGAGGFGGHGLEKLEKEFAAERARERRKYTTDDDPEEEGDDESKKKKKEVDIDALLAIPQTAAVKTGSVIDDMFQGGAMKREKPEPTAALPLKGGSKLDQVRARAALINSRLSGTGGGSARAGVSIDNRGPDAGEYYYKLEINHLPQKARWAVTNKGDVNKVLEATGVSITTKGQYYPPGQEPGPGELAKMNVLIEGDTENAVNSAVAMLKRRLKEAIEATDLTESRAPAATGRYTVV